MSAAQPVRRSAGFLLAYALANAGGVIAYLPLLTLLLPIRVERIAGASRIDVLTIALICGSLAASLSNILFGWLSDAAQARGWGRRRAAAAGLVATAGSYAVVAAAATPPAVVLAVMLFQCAVNALLAPMLAIMAEEVPDGQKGVVGGLLALGNPLAASVSALLVAATMLSETGRLAVVPLLAGACVLPLLLGRPRPAPAADLPSARTALPARDLAVAWGARLLVQVAGNVLSLYLLYYLESIAPGVPQREVAAWTTRLLTLAYLVPLPIAVLVGRVSDRIGRRKPFLLASATIAALGVLGMAMARDWSEGAVAFTLYAAGTAVFLALHSAFAMQLLPDPRHRGRDLGLLNLANTLPGLAGPLLAWSLATPHDFRAVMLALAGLTLAGGVMTLGARGQR